jgi:hypothetical protein
MGIKNFARTLLQPILCTVYNMRGIYTLDTHLDYPLSGKRDFLKTLKQKRPDIKVFIESGTNTGDTVAFLENEFEHVYTIELAETYAQAAKKRFAEKSNVTVIQGDSATEIKNILGDISSSCMFWLDGHYSQGDTAKGELDTPILAELSSCLTHGNQHLILIDDARLFIGRHDYPTLFQLKKFVQEKNPAYSVYVQKDIIILSNEKTHPVFT